MNCYRAVEGQLHMFWTYALYGDDRTDSRPGRINPKIKLHFILNFRLVGPRSRFEKIWGEKKFLSLLGFESRGLVTILTEVYYLSRKQYLSCKQNCVQWSLGKQQITEKYRVSTEQDVASSCLSHWYCVIASTVHTVYRHEGLFGINKAARCQGTWIVNCQKLDKFICRKSLVLNHIKPCGHYMYHQFNIQQFYVLPTQCIYVFCVDLRTNSHYFPIQH
jgi:hypothetical protein